MSTRPPSGVCNKSTGYPDGNNSHMPHQAQLPELKTGGPSSPNSHLIKVPQWCRNPVAAVSSPRLLTAGEVIVQKDPNTAVTLRHRPAKTDSVPSIPPDEVNVGRDRR